jgi:AhpD family alkylhydroperoxidase
MTLTTLILRHGAVAVESGVPMQHSHEVREELRAPAHDLRGLIPEVLRAYGELSRAAMSPGELDSATKELLAIVIAITRECDGCVVSHTRSAVRAGVTRQSLAEAIGVAITMNGGPGTVWGPRALRAYDQAVADILKDEPAH